MELTITAKPRTGLGRQNIKLRRLGQLPAVLYGPKQEAVALQIQAKEFDKVFRQAGENTLVNLTIEGAAGAKKVIIHEVAKHYMKNQAIHVDFYEVDLTKKIHAKIPVSFIGASAAVKELGGILLKNLTEIEVEALPADLPREIEINIEKLATFDDAVRLSDVRLPGGVKILGSPEAVIVAVKPPRSEEELAELEKSTAEAEAEAVAAVAPEPAAAEGKDKEKKEGGEAEAAPAEPKAEEKKKTAE